MKDIVIAYRDRKTDANYFWEGMLDELKERGIDPEDWEQYFEETELYFDDGEAGIEGEYHSKHHSKKEDTITIPVYTDKETGAAFYWLGMVDRLKERGLDVDSWEDYYTMTPKEIQLPPDTRPRYHVTKLSGGYDVLGEEWDRDRSPDINLEMTWRACMCWHGPGSRVLIEDENGNYKIFTKEGDGSNYEH